jgi:PKHD-type hydroxylase
MIIEIPPRNFANRRTAVYVDDFLTDANINKILAAPQWLQTRPAEIGVNADGRQDAVIRRSAVSWMGLEPDYSEIWNKIINAAAMVNAEHFHFDLTGCYEPMQLGVYHAEDNGHYNWHTDANADDTNVPRKLSMALLLSDPEEFVGGDLEFKVHDDTAVTAPQRRGRAWFFPSYVLHRVTPVTQGQRRSAVLWMGGPAFR